MTTHSKLLSLLLAAAFVSPFALANDVEGEVKKLDRDEKSLEVQGITFYTDERTHYAHGMHNFDDLKEGEMVEVDFDYRGDRHYATKIEKESRRESRKEMKHERESER